MKVVRWITAMLMVVLLCAACAQHETISQAQAQDIVGRRAVTIASSTAMRTDDVTVNGNDCYRFEMLVFKDERTIVVGQVIAVSKDGRHLYCYDEQKNAWNSVTDA